MGDKDEMSNLKPEKDAMTSAIENNPCGICRAMGFPACKGHGGGGGSDESKDEDVTSKKDPTQDNNVTQDKAYTSKEETRAAQLTTDIKKLDEFKSVWVQSQLSSDRTINYDAGLLSIESDRLHGKLSFRIKSGLSKDQTEVARQFLKAVKTEFDEFKNQLATQSISTQKFSVYLKDNELTVHIPNPKYYDVFIKHLENKNLLPVPNPILALQKITESAHVPAISYACVVPNKENSEHEFISTSLTFGKKNITDDDTSVNDYTRFPASSLSKIVFTYLVLQWAKENKINLDEPLHDILKKKQIELDRPLDDVLKYDRFVEKGEYPEQAKQLTIRHILSHTTGLPNVGADPDSTLAFNSNPGEKYSYSGEAFLYLQKVLEAITGENLEDLARRYVFKPLGMENSTFLPQPENDTNVVAVHTEIGKPTPIYVGDPPVHAAGSLLTTAQDFSKFMVAWLENMDDDSIFKQAFEPTTTDDFSTCGLGWHIYRNEGVVIAYQFGENPNTRSFIAINVTDRKGAVFFTNSENGMRIANQLLSSSDFVPIANTEKLFERMPNYPQGYDPVWQNTLEGLIAEDQGMFDLARDKFAKALELNDHTSNQLRLEWFNAVHSPTPEQEFKKPPLEHFEGMLTNEHNEQRKLFIREGSLIQEQFGKEIKLVRISKTDFLPEKDQSFRISFNEDRVSIDFIDGANKQFDKHPLPSSYTIITTSLGHQPALLTGQAKQDTFPAPLSEKRQLDTEKPIKQSQDEPTTEYNEECYQPKMW